MYEDLKKFLESLTINEDHFGDTPTLAYLCAKDSDFLNKLKEFELFKNVKKINVLSFPNYIGSLENCTPIEFVDNYIGGDTKHCETLNYMVRPENSSLVFNEEIDLYKIFLSAKSYETKDLGFGIWKLPTTYDISSFTPKNKIEITYSLEQIMDYKVLNENDAKSYLKKNILDEVSRLIDLKPHETNVPFKRDIMVRCSSRSIKITK